MKEWAADVPCECDDPCEHRGDYRVQPIILEEGTHFGVSLSTKILCGCCFLGTAADMALGALAGELPPLAWDIIDLATGISLPELAAKQRAARLN